MTKSVAKKKVQSVKKATLTSAEPQASKKRRGMKRRSLLLLTLDDVLHNVDDVDRRRSSKGDKVKKRFERGIPELNKGKEAEERLNAQTVEQRINLQEIKAKAKVDAKATEDAHNLAEKEAHTSGQRNTESINQ
ncbi:hypothetical protein L1887_00821 [Cichorium endivia]|nr:hypothetical protein L1887_00821 [Cichorium endivia]